MTRSKTFYLFFFSIREHVCLLQPTTPRQTGQTDRHKGSDVHGSSSTQRWVLYSIYSTSLYQFYFFFISSTWHFSTSCRLQQDFQSLSGWWAAAAGSHSASSTLHPHGSVFTQAQNTHTHTSTHSWYCIFNRVCEGGCQTTTESLVSVSSYRLLNVSSSYITTVVTPCYSGM